MTPEEKNQIRNALMKTTAAVNYMMDANVTDEEKSIWINVYNFYLSKMLNEYLADEPAPAEEAPEVEVLPAEPENE